MKFKHYYNKYMGKNDLQYCPICGQQVPANPRYPTYACKECEAKAVDEDGQPVQFHNTSELGHGCQGTYTKSDKSYDKNICYIKGVKCRAEEAYFGGIVIQKI